MTSPPLQSLIVTTGWLVAYHQFHAIDPTPDRVSDMQNRWFKEDMYQARNDHRNRMIDLGWYREGTYTSGAFRLVLYQGDFTGQLLRVLQSQDRPTIVNAMNEWFEFVSDGTL